jgi:hypothetical protein
MELSTPVMQVWQGVVVAPLIGSLDSNRTQQFMERLLNRLVETNSPVALVDIMGVPTIDAHEDFGPRAVRGVRFFRTLRRLPLARAGTLTAVSEMLT